MRRSVMDCITIANRTAIVPRSAAAEPDSGTLPRQLHIAQVDRPPAASWRDTVRLSVDVFNNSSGAREAVVRISAPSGNTLPVRQELQLKAGERRAVSFTWWPGPRSPGLCELRAEATAEAGGVSASASCPVRVRIVPEPDLPLVVAEVKADDIQRGKPYHISVALTNVSRDDEVEATVRCALLEARRYPAAKTVQIAPGESATIEWTGAAEEPPLDKGEYTVRVYVAEAHGVTATAKFAVRLRSRTTCAQRRRSTASWAARS